MTGILFAGCGSAVVLTSPAPPSSPTPTSPAGPWATPQGSPGPTTTGATDESPAPTLEAGSGPTPASSASVSGWPVAGAALPVFGPDGTLYTTLGQADEPQELVALDARGILKPGWPFRFPDAAKIRISDEPVVGRDGWLYVTACGYPTGPCGLHRISREGTEKAPWPIALTGMTDCSGPALGSDGTVYATCSAGRRAGDAGLTIAVDAAGVKSGWPVEIGGRSIAVASDGGIYVGWWQPSDDPAAPPLSVTALAPDGSPRPGWPVSLPADLAFFAPGPDGRLYLGWYEGMQRGEGGFIARRTVFTALGPDGRPLAGWPRGSVGASSAALGPDGMLYYATAAGNVYAHDRAGQINRGWPVRGVADSGLAGSPVYESPLGSIYVLTENNVTALAPDGRQLTGWPWGPGREGSLSWCWRDTPCADDVRDRPVFAPDGTVYLKVYRPVDETGYTAPEIDAIDPTGHTKPGWPPSIVAIGWEQWLRVGPDGRVYVQGDGGLNALMPDGTRVK